MHASGLYVGREAEAGRKSVSQLGGKKSATESWRARTRNKLKGEVFFPLHANLSVSRPDFVSFGLNFLYVWSVWVSKGLWLVACNRPAVQLQQRYREEYEERMTVKM